MNYFCFLKICPYPSIAMNIASTHCNGKNLKTGICFGECLVTLSKNIYVIIAVFAIRLPNRCQRVPNSPIKTITFSSATDRRIRQSFANSVHLLSLRYRQLIVNCSLHAASPNWLNQRWTAPIFLSTKIRQLRQLIAVWYAPIAV